MYRLLCPQFCDDITRKASLPSSFAQPALYCVYGMMHFFNLIYFTFCVRTIPLLRPLFHTAHCHCFDVMMCRAISLLITQQSHSSAHSSTQLTRHNLDVMVHRAFSLLFTILLYTDSTLAPTTFMQLTCHSLNVMMRYAASLLFSHVFCTAHSSVHSLTQLIRHSLDVMMRRAISLLTTCNTYIFCALHSFAHSFTFFLQPTRHGLDVMMRRVVSEMRLLTKDANEDISHDSLRCGTVQLVWHYFYRTWCSMCADLNHLGLPRFRLQTLRRYCCRSFHDLYCRTYTVC